MRKLTLIACLIFLPMLSGCTVSDALFAVFGANYTGGGITRAEKEDHYNRQFEASPHYEPWNP